MSKTCSLVAQHAIFEFLKRFPSTKGAEFLINIPPEHIFKTLHFSSLKCSADLFAVDLSGLRRFWPRIGVKQTG